MADLGGEGNLTQLQQDLISRYVETDAVADYLAGTLVTAGALTPRGRSRAALTAYLQVLDRQHRLAVAPVLDELAFFRVEGGADSDAEIQMSLRRGMVSFARTRLIKISTPYLRSGVLFDDFTRAWGQDDPDLLVWRASSLLMNPTLHAERLAREQRLDPTRYAREYLGEFTSTQTRSSRALGSMPPSSPIATICRPATTSPMSARATRAGAAPRRSRYACRISNAWTTTRRWSSTSCGAIAVSVRRPRT